MSGSNADVGGRVWEIGELAWSGSLVAETMFRNVEQQQQQSQEKVTRNATVKI